MEADDWNAAAEVDEILGGLRVEIVDEWTRMGQVGAATNEVEAAREAAEFGATAYRLIWESMRDHPSWSAPEAREALEEDWEKFARARELNYSMIGLEAPTLLMWEPNQTTPVTPTAAGPPSVAAARWQIEELAYSMIELQASPLLTSEPNQTTPATPAAAGPSSVAAAVHATLPAPSGPPSRARSHSSAAAGPAVVQPAAPRRNSMSDLRRRSGPR